MRRCLRSWSWSCPFLPLWCSWSSPSRSSSPFLCQILLISWSQACFEQRDLKFLEMGLRRRVLAWVCWLKSLWWSLLLNLWFWSWWHTGWARIQHPFMSRPFSWCSEQNVSGWSRRAIWRWRPWRILGSRPSSHFSRWSWAQLGQCFFWFYWKACIEVFDPAIPDQVLLELKFPGGYDLLFSRGGFPGYRPAFSCCRQRYGFHYSFVLNCELWFFVPASISVPWRSGVSCHRRVRFGFVRRAQEILFHLRWFESCSTETVISLCSLAESASIRSLTTCQTNSSTADYEQGWLCSNWSKQQTS